MMQFVSYCLVVMCMISVHVKCFQSPVFTASTTVQTHIGHVISSTRLLQTLGSSDANSCKSLVIWDCDGVLVDSEALLKQGEVEALEKLGFKLTAADCVRLFSGVSPDQAMQNFEKEMGETLPSDFFQKQIDGSMGLFRDRLQPLMANTVRQLHQKGYAMCVASGSPRPRVDLCVEVAGMLDPFPPDQVFTRELVARGKPAPDLFLYAAEKMRHAPEKCVVIEDSTAGIEAGLNAEMSVIGFLGGGHTKNPAYVEAIMKYGVPVVDTEEEVFVLIDNQMCR